MFKQIIEKIALQMNGEMPLFKKGDRREPRNYREISILNTCYKIYSKILNMKLQKYSEVFMTETQNAFRYGRSETDQTFCLKLLIETGREFNWETHLVFIGCEKAFGNRQRQILFSVFNSRHIADTLITKQCIFTHTKKTFIKFNHKISKLVQINKAVPQGCPLSPTLFNIYLDEIITKWQKQDINGIKL